MAETKTCETCGQPFRRTPNTSLITFALRKFCGLGCRRRKVNDQRNRERKAKRGGCKGAKIGHSADALYLVASSRYIGPLTRDVHTLAVAELRDVRLTLDILRSQGRHTGELARHEARLSAVVARGWEVRV